MTVTNDRTYDVLCAGIIVADLVCRPVPQLPPPGGLVLTSGMELTIGGCAANVATDFAKLGRRVAIAGSVGDDLFGRHVEDSLRTVGIDCRFLTVSSQYETACTMVLNVIGEDRRFVHVLGANTEFTGRELSEDAIASAAVLSVGGFGLVDALSPDNVKQMFSLARRHGVQTVLDVVLAEPRDYLSWLKPVLPLTDFFLPNTDEAKLLTGFSDPLQQAEAFHAAGANVAVVTCGSEGAVLVTDNLRLQSNAAQTKTVDATGSGDAFLAGFLHARLNGGDWSDCLQHGAALGASCVQNPGATTGIPTADKLAQLVRDAPVDVTQL